MTRPVVGCKVIVAASGRIGELIVDDGSDLPFKVQFSDGLVPEADWFKDCTIKSIEDNAQGAVMPACEVSPAMDVACPICFTSQLETPVFTACGHVFCAACIEHAITTCRTEDPTAAPCPMCRTEVSFFDLCTVEGHQPLHLSSEDLTPLAGYTFVQRHAWAAFGFASFHFENATTAYVSYESPQCSSENLTLDDGRPPPLKVYFEESRWHARTRTFHAFVTWEGASWHRSRKWKYVIQFSNNFDCICGGSIVMLGTDEDCALDGMWRVEWENGASANISIKGGTWDLQGLSYTLNLSDPRRFFFTWPGLGTLQHCCIDPDNVREVGSLIMWVTDNPEYPTISWVRLERGSDTPAPLHVERFGPQGLQYIRQFEAARMPPCFCNGSVWGNCYVQDLKIGLASYHFLEGVAQGEQCAFISYEHPQCANWPSLDNGTPLPARVPFTDVTWNIDARHFQGIINWLTSYGTTWQGVEKWKYDMIFDADFMYITTGCCQQIDSGGSVEYYHFGEDLAYINAAAGQQLTSKRERGENWATIREAYAKGGATQRILANLRRAWDADIRQ